MWECYDIDVLIWYYSRVGEYDHGGSEGSPPPASYLSSIERLVSSGLLEETRTLARPYQATELGVALVGLWKQTPLPVVKFVDPRLVAA